MAASANLLAVALFFGPSAFEARSVQLEDGFFTFLVFDAICSLPALFRIYFIVCHEPRLVDCVIRILWIANRKRSCVDRGKIMLLSFAERYGVALDNCGRLSIANESTQV